MGELEAQRNDELRELNQDMHRAAQVGDPIALARALSAGANPRDRLPNTSFALLSASWSGNLACVELLLPLSDPKAAGVHGMTALMMAVLKGHMELIHALLPVSDPLARDELGSNALSYAMLKEQEQAAQVLWPVSDPYGRMGPGQSSMEIARANGNHAFAERMEAWAAMEEAKALSASIGEKKAAPRARGLKL